MYVAGSQCVKGKKYTRRKKFGESRVFMLFVQLQAMWLK